MEIKLRTGVWLFFSLVVIVLLLQATHPSWYWHLHTDINVYFARASYFLNNKGLVGLVGNEYQPGALFFFIALSPILLIISTFKAYLLMVFAANILLLGLLSLLYKKVENIFLFLLILLLTGPIVLARFDIFVMCLLVASFFFWKREKHILATLLLAIAALVKIFPAVLVPYYLILTFKNRGIKETLNILLVFLAGYFGFLIIFTLLFRAPLSILFESFKFLSKAPIHTESVWGTAMTLIAKLGTGSYAKGTGAWGIFGIDPSYTVGPLNFYNYFWIFSVVLFYVWLFPKLKKDSGFDVRICIVAIMLFLVFSKIIHHQYTLWFMLLFPLLNIKYLLTQTRDLINLFLILLMTSINQYIYPLNYTNFISGFYADGSYSYLFWLATLRNILLILILARLFIEVRESFKIH
ncbi:MAG: glycosyltransferase 87 family protein [Patescibacteria group bacterium]